MLIAYHRYIYFMYFIVCIFALLGDLVVDRVAKPERTLYVCGCVCVVLFYVLYIFVYLYKGPP